MKITVLAAEKAVKGNFKTDKEQSFLIQTGDRNLLYGFGESAALLKNFESLGLHSDIVDTAFLASPTIPGGGGITKFFFSNRRAVIYVRLNAFDNIYKKGLLGYKEIGTDKRLAKKKRIIRCKNYFLSPDGQFATLSYEKQDGTDDGVFLKEDGGYVPDNGSGDLYLLVPEKKTVLNARGKAVEEKVWALFVGQSRVGFNTIVSHVDGLISRTLGGRLGAIVGGFGLVDKKGKVLEERVEEVISYLENKDVAVYTGGSTGKAFARLKEKLGEKVQEYAVGMQVEV